MIRRAWHVLADPPASTLAFVVALLIPIELILIALALLRGSHPGFVLARVVLLVAAFVVLAVVRQRDRARAEVARLRGWQP